jgi:phage recombination protein Bet
MTDTTTAERVDEENLVDAAHRAAEEAQHKQVATVTPAAQGFEEFQLAVRRMLGLEDASEGEMRLFWHLSQKSGLDPFNKEIYMIGRNTEVGMYEPVDSNEPDGPKRKVMRWVTKYTTQVGINGFRKRAREISDSKGIKLGMGEALWCGEDGVWREVWPEKKSPTAAKFTVFRDGEPFSFVAHYDEYVQNTGGGEPNSMWKKMPRNQTRKCAEAGAIQMAFPDELGGLILEDAAQPDIIDQDGNLETPQQRRRPTGSGVDGMRAAREAREAQQQPQPTVVDAEPSEPAPTPAEPPTTPAAPKPPISPANRQKWLNSLSRLFKQGDCEDRTDQLIVIRGAAKAYAEANDQPDPNVQLEHRDDISDDQLYAVVTQLNHWNKEKTLASRVTELLNLASIDELNAEHKAEAEADADAAAASDAPAEGGE